MHTLNLSIAFQKEFCSLTVCEKACFTLVLFKLNYLFIFGYTGGLLLWALSVVAASVGCSLVGVHRLFIAVASLVAEQALERVDFSSSSAQAWLPHSMWNLLRPGIEPVSPALAGGFSTTGPRGKSHCKSCSTLKFTVIKHFFFFNFQNSQFFQQ